VEKLAHYVDKVGKTWVELIIRAHLLERITQIANTRVTLIVMDFWQLFSHIFGETSLIVTHIWPKPTCVIKICNLTLLVQDSIDICHREGK